MKAGAVAALSVITASVAFAAPGPRRDGPTCDSREAAATLRKLLRHPKSYGGPLARRPYATKHRLLIDLSSHLRRPKRLLAGADAAAIQNDGAAARIDGEGQTAPQLRSFGVLPRPVDSHPHTHAFSPRSPRGPPAYS